MSLRTGNVTGRQTSKNRDPQGLPVRLLQVMVSDPSDIQTVQLLGQAGEESNPINGSLVAILPTGQAFKLAIAGDDGVVPVMEVGGKRVYAVDPATGAVVADAKFHPDGKIELTNNLSKITMNADGTILVHGVSVTFDCPITAPEATIGGKVISTHIHTDPQGGNTGGPV